MIYERTYHWKKSNLFSPILKAADDAERGSKLYKMGD
jgi:hypothetical protein